MESMLEGFMHPLLGEDHLLAMMLVGLLSVQMGGRAIYTVPAGFVAFLAIGCVYGLMGFPLPMVEGVIALSVLLLGLSITFAKKATVPFAFVSVAVFAFFHGHAHAAEIPNHANPTQFIIGFMLASTLLHITGIGVGELSNFAKNPSRLREILGAMAAGIGFHLLLLVYHIV